MRVRYKLREVTWPELLRRLERLNCRAAIVGPHGAGKTTLLEDLEPVLVQRGFTIRRLRLDEEHRSFDRGFLNDFCAGLNQRDAILFDGAEQLNRWAWLKFKSRTRTARGLIITSHDTGRLPTLIECRTTPELLGEIVGEVLGGKACFVYDLAPELFRKYDGNLRDALRELYDLFADTMDAGIASDSAPMSRVISR